MHSLNYKKDIIPPTAFTDADLGALYNNAKSPNASPYFNVFFNSLFIII